MTKFGTRIRQLREARHLLQRHMAAGLNMDTPLLSKIERGERRAKKEQLPLFAALLKVPEEELLTLWLADQLYELVKDEELALQAIQVAEDQVRLYQKKK